MPTFPPRRTDALARLAEFIPRAPRYATERNFVRPGHADVSRLSPLVQKRLVLESEIAAAALAVHPFPAVEKFVQEVYWRTYWKGWLEHRPAAWHQWCLAVADRRRELSPADHARHETARAGRTGIAGFDAWAHELVATGYLHNHARMWFASIWIFTLRLPWELGAAFFYEHLLDGDPASNTLSWRWVAGLQTAGKTYLARADNIARYTEGRHAPADAQLASLASALREDPLPKTTPWQETAPVLLGQTRERIGAWIHPEDLSLEVGECADLPVAAVFAAWPTSLATRAGWSEQVTAWTQSALRDGARRAAEHFGASAHDATVDDLAREVVAWAQSHRLDRIVAFRPFVGPWLDEALALERALAAVGITLTWRRRAWDTTLFPLATRGYFPFWETVKSQLSSNR